MDREGDLAAWRHLINHHHPLSGNGGDHKFTFIHFLRCNFTFSTNLSQVTIKSFSLHSDSDSRHAASQIFGPTVSRRRKLGQRMPLQPESTSPSTIHPSSIHLILRIQDSSGQKIAPIVPDLSIAASNPIYCWTLRKIPPLQILQPPSHVYYYESSISSKIQDTVLSQKVRTGSGERMPTTMFTHSHSSDRRGDQAAHM